MLLNTKSIRKALVRPPASHVPAGRVAAVGVVGAGAAAHLPHHRALRPRRVHLHHDTETGILREYIYLLECQ